MSLMHQLEQVGMRLLPLHDSIYQKSHGWLGHRIPGMPNSCCYTPSVRRAAGRAPRRCRMPATATRI